MVSSQARKLKKNNSATTVFWAFSHGRLENGGDHRATQIAELLASANRQTVVVERQRTRPPLWQAIWNIGRRMLLNWQLPSRFPRGWLTFAADYQLCRDLQAQHQPIDCLIMEATTEYQSIPLLKKLTRRLILTPQNIESLGAQRTAVVERNSRSFGREVNAYAIADEIFTISVDEMWMFQLFGLSTKCLPYYPPEVLCERLREIRTARSATTTKSQFLVLGTMSNPPTREGTYELVQWLAGSSSEPLPSIAIAGNGTEVLQDETLPASVEILGRVSNESLDELRRTIKGLIVHQRVTTGMITRISESLVAGIPVLANVAAARGYETTAGVHVYRDQDELLELLQRDFPMPPIPPRPVFEEQQFLASVFGAG